MMPDASRWRSSEIYDLVEELTASDLAWEWLRRNEAYDRDFTALASRDIDPHALTDRIRQRWGLRFPDRSFARSSRSPRLLASRRRHQRRHPADRTDLARR